MYACTRGIIIALVLAVRRSSQVCEVPADSPKVCYIKPPAPADAEDSRLWAPSPDCTVDLAVTNLRASQVRDDSIDVSWDPPASQQHCVDGYVVTVTDSVTWFNKEYYTNDHHLTVKDLEECTPYTVTVSLKWISYLSEGRPINVTTNPGKDNIVSDLGGVRLSVRYVTSDSATVVLVKPEERAVCLHLFNVTVSWAADGHVSNTTEPQPADQPVTLHRLLAACTNYSVQARIHTESSTAAVLNGTFQTGCKRDDQEPETSNTREQPTCDCFLPAQYLNRRFCTFKKGCEHCTGRECAYQLDDTVQHQVKVTCKPGFGFIDGSDNAMMECGDTGKWESSFPRCVRLCPPLQSDSLIINCTNADSKVDCDKPMVPGTTAEYRCRPNHNQLPGLAQDGLYDRPLHCDQTGEWSGPLYPCQSDLNSAKNRSPSNDAVLSQSPTGRCVLPAQSLNRRFCSLNIGCEHCTGRECAYGPSDTVQHQVKVTCEPGFGLSDGSDNAIMVCEDGGTWHASFPECVKLCPPLKSNSIIVNCKTGVSKVDCDKPMVPGTTAEYRCRPNHNQLPGLAQDGLYDRPLHCDQTGEWSGPLYPCEPACGQSKVKSTIPSQFYRPVSWDDITSVVFPWYAGIYANIDTSQPRSWTRICGGTLITKLVVLTAAHCVHQNQLRLSPDNVTVHLGDSYESWYLTEKYWEFRNVTHILVQPGYRGPIDNHAFDIALMVLDVFVPVNCFIMPVCTDFSMSWDVASNKTGYFVNRYGGQKENGNYFDTLGQANILVGSSCHNIVPSNKLVGEDKICSVESAEGSVIQRGEREERGGGLTMIGDGGLHYIVGIISAKIDNVTLFTNLEWANHQEWIESNLKSYM